MTLLLERPLGQFNDTAWPVHPLEPAPIPAAEQSEFARHPWGAPEQNCPATSREVFSSGAHNIVPPTLASKGNIFPVVEDFLATVEAEARSYGYSSAAAAHLRGRAAIVASKVPENYKKIERQEAQKGAEALEQATGRLETLRNIGANVAAHLRWIGFHSLRRLGVRVEGHFDDKDRLFAEQGSGSYEPLNRAAPR